MSEITRRDVMTTAATTGAAAAVVATLLHGETATAAETQLPPNAEQQVVLQCGFTREEANAWVLTNELATQLMQLPGFSDLDRQEITRSIQYIQTKLMSMPTNRRYGQLIQGRR